MGTYKRPLPEGVACEDTRLEFNPKLGAGKAVEAKPEVAVEKPAKPAKPVKYAEPAKYAEPSREEVAEIAEAAPEVFEAVTLTVAEGME